jgi:hypothetical protein
MPAAAIIIPLAESFGLSALGVTAGGVGAAALGAVGLEASTIVASTVGGAIIGAGTGALNAAIQGGDIGKGALTGGVAGGVGSGVGALTSQALGATAPLPAGVQGPSAPATVGGSAALGSGVVGSASQGAGSFAGALAGGAPLSTALQAGLRGVELGGISGLASGFAKEAGVSARDASSIGSAASQLASYALPSVSGGSAKPSYTTPVQPSLSLQGPAPSPTLGQSLSIAPTLGYSPSGSVFGSSDTEGKKSNVWNVGSLRNIGAAEA